MRAKFFDHEAVHFVAGRIFTHDGKKIFPGEVIEDAREWKNLEAVVRSRYLWPVAEDLSVLPTRMQKEVKSVEFAREKLRADRYLVDIEERDTTPEEPVEEEPVDFQPDWTNKQLKAYLDEHPQDIKKVLEFAKEQNRPRLIKELEERLAVPDEEDIDV